MAQDRTPLVLGAGILGLAGVALAVALAARSPARQGGEVAERPAAREPAPPAEIPTPPPARPAPPPDRPAEPPPPAEDRAKQERAAALARDRAAAEAEAARGEFAKALDALAALAGKYPEAKAELAEAARETTQLAEAALEEAQGKGPAALRDYALRAPEELAARAVELARGLEALAAKAALEKKVSAAETLARAGRFEDAAAALEDAAPAMPAADAAAARARAAGWRRLARYAGALPPESLARTDPETLRVVEEAVEEFLAAGEPDARNAAFRRITARADATPELVAGVVLLGGKFEDAAAGDQVVEFALPDGPKRQMVVSVPEGYTPKKAWPVFVHLHGTHGTLDMCRGFAPHYRAIAAGRYIVAQPAAAKSTGWGPSWLGEQQAPAALRALRTRFNVDPDRVWLGGVSMGAHGTWHQAMRHADLYAAFLPRSGSPYRAYGSNWEAWIDNLRFAPSYFIHGARDPMFPVDTVRIFTGKAAEKKLAVDYREFRESGHEGAPDEEIRKSYEWMTAQTRNPYPTAFAWNTDHENFARHSWLAATAFTPNAKRDNVQFLDDAKKPVETRSTLHTPARFSVEVAGQTISLRTTGIARMKVLWNPRVVDLAKEVVIRANGRQVWKGVPAVSVRQMLDEAAATGRRDLVFYGALEIDIP